jgi:hypothetical protein
MRQGTTQKLVSLYGDQPFPRYHDLLKLISDPSEDYYLTLSNKLGPLTCIHIFFTICSISKNDKLFGSYVS